MAERLISKLFSKLPAKSSTQTPESSKTRKHKPPLLKFIFFIVNWQQSKIVTDVLKEEKSRFYFVGKGTGTARSETLDLLGIGTEDKAVIILLEQAVLVPVLLKEVMKKLNFANPGTGIAFTLPISAINDPLMLIFKPSIYKNEKIPSASAGAKAASALAAASASPGKRGGNMANKHSHDLIVAIVNHGYSNEVMTTAREAGATGGTVFHARGHAHEGAVKFFGVSVQDEKEIIIIITSCDKKVNIMRAVSEAHGLNSESQGIILSLPVDDVMGLSLE